MAEPLNHARGRVERVTVDDPSSHVRERAAAPLERAVQRVSEYLRALGLTEASRVQELSAALCAQVTGAVSGDDLPELAVAHAQERVESFWQDVFGASAGDVDPLWLRSFAGAFPALFLGDVQAARGAARKFGDPRVGRGPAHAVFRDQTLEPLSVPRWLLGLSLPLSLTLAASTALFAGLAEGGPVALKLVWLSLFAVLSGCSAIGFTTVVIGFCAPARRVSPAATSEGELPRTALLMPIYHESAEHVFAALAAMRESLAREPGGTCFEIFVLSDSRDPERAAEEERAFRRVASDEDAAIPTYYRRRARNERQKAGNLAEFFERWGHRYTYAVVLDADSLIGGHTLVELVRRMEAAPQVALLQAPLALHRGTTLFARMQQLATSVSGPLFTRGLALWAGPHGNYFGHNAILRVRAFLDCCALPKLRGEPPLGGHILSHDFVEAALLCRAGWDVRMADDLGESWEELPPTLPEYVARDRRWCQGNLQHVRVAVSRGLRPMSRVHMASGVASYLAGPLWLAFVGLGLVLAHGRNAPLVKPGIALSLAIFTGMLLLAPRLLGVLATLRDRERRRLHGGAPRLLLSTLLELVFSAALAPLLMLHHTRIVFSILLGHTVRWGAQQRRAVGQIGACVRSELPSTCAGLALVAWLTYAAPQWLGYMAPLWVPWVCAIPLSLAASSDAMGRLLARAGLLSVPSEVAPSELALRADEWRALTAADEAACFRDLVLDPVLVATHVTRLERAAGASETTHEPRSSKRAGPRASKTPLPAPALMQLCQRALRAGPAGLTANERKLLRGDAASMRLLHREAWRHWPVEAWRLSRERPLLPPEPV